MHTVIYIYRISYNPIRHFVDECPDPDMPFPRCLFDCAAEHLNHNSTKFNPINPN